LDASNEVGSWPRYYDSLKLFSPARFSSMPGMKFPGDENGYPKRDEVIRYLQDYRAKFHLPVRTNQRVASVERNGEGFTVRTMVGDTFRGRTIINATGSFHNPYTPVLPGQEVFQGRTLHSSEYRNPEPFRNQRVVVVGRGNSAVQIGVELAEVSKTSLAVLRPVQFVQQKGWGQDVHFWVRLIGFDTFPFCRDFLIQMDINAFAYLISFLDQPRSLERQIFLIQRDVVGLAGNDDRIARKLLHFNAIRHLAALA
jgi:putative flavoprotein involved in K+ transport